MDIVILVKNLSKKYQFLNKDFTAEVAEIAETNDVVFTCRIKSVDKTG